MCPSIHPTIDFYLLKTHTTPSPVALGIQQKAKRTFLKYEYHAYTGDTQGKMSNYLTWPKALA